MTRQAKLPSVAPPEGPKERTFRVRCARCGQSGLWATRKGLQAAGWLANLAEIALLTGLQAPSDPPVTVLGTCGECVKRETRPTVRLLGWEVVS